MALPVYDPKKDYHWHEDEIFTLTGIQFASFYHLLMRAMNNPGGAPLANVVEAYNVMWKIYIEGIASGKIVPETEPVPEALGNQTASNDPLVNNLFAK
jgi:hypothetical protein